MLARLVTVMLVGSALSLLVFQMRAVSKSSHKACENGEQVSFRRDVLPALQASCASCHYSDEIIPPLNLTSVAAYKSIVGKKSSFVDAPLVKLGDPQGSFLVEKIGKNPRFGQQMPPYGRPLRARELNLLIDWVKQGAKNN